MIASTQPVTSRRAAKASTRQKLLDAGLAVLIEEGYAGLSMNKVAKRAGIAQPSFYAHFDSTDQLLDTLADDLLERYLTPFQSTVRTLVQQLPPTEARALIQRLFLLAFSVVRAQEPLVRMVWSERAQRVSRFGQRLRDLFARIKREWAQVLLDVGLVPADPASQVRLQIFMDSIFALFETSAVEWLDGHYNAEQALANALTDYVMQYWATELNAFFRDRPA